MGGGTEKEEKETEGKGKVTKFAGKRLVPIFCAKFKSNVLSMCASVCVIAWVGCSGGGNNFFWNFGVNLSLA